MAPGRVVAGAVGDCPRWLQSAASGDRDALEVLGDDDVVEEGARFVGEGLRVGIALAEVGEHEAAGAGVAGEASGLGRGEVPVPGGERRLGEGPPGRMRPEGREFPPPCPAAALSKRGSRTVVPPELATRGPSIATRAR